MLPSGRHPLVKIISTTIAGPGSEGTIARALDSAAEYVDGILVLANGSDEEVERIRVAIEAGTVPAVFGRFDWTNDFSAARNHALEVATATGADWCLWIDTDEWFEPALRGDGRKVRAQIEGAAEGALMVYHASGTYCQPRAIRLPTSERWAGKTHECFPAFKVGQGQLSALRFNESEKTAEQLKQKFERDEAILLAEVEANPADARSWFYLGETAKNIGNLKTALAAYDLRAQLRGWNEESAWACYRAAECCIALGNLEDAIDRCARGLALHSGIAELAWLAGWCNYKLRRYEQAIHWASMAVITGNFTPNPVVDSRIGFRFLPGLYEAPFDVLRHSYAALGMVSAAALAESKLAAAMQMRLDGTPRLRSNWDKPGL